MLLPSSDDEAETVSEDSATCALERSLLYAMCVPGSVFMRALESFEHRTLMAMVDHDLLVPFGTYVFDRRS